MSNGRAHARIAGSMSTTASQTMASPRPIGPDVLAGLGLDVHGRFADAEQPGEVGADGRLVRAELGLLGVDDHVAIDGPPSGPLDLFDDLRQSRVLSSPRHWGSVSGIVLADIAQAGRPQERIGHRVADDVGVGVAQQPARMLDPRVHPGSAAAPRPADACRARSRPARRSSVLNSRNDSRPVPYKRPARIVAFLSRS